MWITGNTLQAEVPGPYHQLRYSTCLQNKITGYPLHSAIPWWSRLCGGNITFVILLFEVSADGRVLACACSPFFVNAQQICTSGALCRELYVIVTVLFWAYCFLQGCIAWLMALLIWVFSNDATHVIMDDRFLIIWMDSRWRHQWWTW